VRRPLLIALAAAAVYLLATRVDALRTADLRILEGFMGIGHVPLAEQAYRLVGLFDPAPFAVLVDGIVAAAYLMGRTKVGLLAAGAMVAAAVTSQILKDLLAVQRGWPLGHWMGPEAWPSGHSTGVMSFALALVLIAPPTRRWLAAAAGGVLTVTTVYGILISGWHYPSDVIGGFLVATFWASLAVIPLRARERVSLRAPAIAASVLAGAALVVIASRPGAAAAYAVANTTFVIGALAIAFAALALSGSVLAPTGARAPSPGRSPHARG
jgi:membrane-associated phospholipid phosphatase